MNDNEQYDDSMQRDHVTPPPRYLTEHDVPQLMELLAHHVAPYVQTQPGGDQVGDHDWETSLRRSAAEDATSATMRHVEAMNRPILLERVLDKVAGDLPDDVRSELANEMSSLSSVELAAALNHPDSLKKLARLARGIHSEQATAPRSSSSGTVGAGSVRESELADKFWRDYREVPGFTKEMAREMAKERA